MKKNPFGVNYLVVILAILLFAQCHLDEVFYVQLNDTNDNPVRIALDTIDVVSDLEADEVWKTGNIYILRDLISITNGATLTIQPGVLVKAIEGPTGLVVTRGSKLDAQGTAAAPIIFTSVNDLIELGPVVSPNLGMNDVGLWSGLFILGNAPVSTDAANTSFALLPTDPKFAYGGESISDNSGTLNYVSIRHTGFEIVEYETPSGLNLAAVGNGTSISNVEILATEDDAFVLDGGTVNLENIIAAYFRDDGIDCDRGWSGSLNNVIGIGAAEFDAAIEVDGGEGISNPSFMISNVSFKGSTSGEDYIDFRKGVNCAIQNAYFFNFDESSRVKLEEDIDADNWINERIDIINIEINTSHLTTGNMTLESIFVDRGENGNDAFRIRAPDAAIVTTSSTGADKAVFENWTAIDQSGVLEEF